MEVAIKKQFTIELDVVKGEIELHNPDEIAYLELLGMLEYAKMMITKDWLEE